VGKHPAPDALARASPTRREVGRPVVGAATLGRIRLIAESLFSTEAGPPSLDRLDWLVHEMDDFLGRSGTQTRWTFSIMVFVVTALAPLFIGRLRTLPHVERPDRVAALQAMERRFGEPLLAVKAILCLVYYEHPDAAREIGFDGACLLPKPEEP
jgi:hypothetical protein